MDRTAGGNRIEATRESLSNVQRESEKNCVLTPSSVRTQFLSWFAHCGRFRGRRRLLLHLRGVRILPWGCDGQYHQCE